MPTRNTLAIALTLAGSVACGGFLAEAHAASLDDVAPLKAQGRDLVPAPSRPGPADHNRPHVTLRPTSTVVHVGAPISFEVGSSIDGYGHIYVLSASGRVQVWMENVPIAAGERLFFPTGGIGILAAPPAGREDLMMIVTRERIDGFFGHRTTRSPQLLDYDQHAFKRALAAKFSDLPHRQWGYARTSVQVVARADSGSGWGWGHGSGQRRSDPWAGQWDDEN